MDSSNDPISKWIQRLPDGDSYAQQQIWRAVATKIERLARKRLNGISLADSNEEDIAAKVLKSLFERVQDGRIHPPSDRQELWNLLKGMTRNKSIQEYRKKNTMKRGGDRKQHPLEETAGDMSSPQVRLEEAEALTDRLESLEDESLSQIALLKMAGCTNNETAEALKCSLRTVERKLQTIRELWTAT